MQKNTQETTFAIHSDLVAGAPALAPASTAEMVAAFTECFRCQVPLTFTFERQAEMVLERASCPCCAGKIEARAYTLQ